MEAYQHGVGLGVPARSSGQTTAGTAVLRPAEPAGRRRGRRATRRLGACVCALVASVGPCARIRSTIAPRLAERVTSLTRESSWTLVPPIPIAFKTHHPQGMVKIGQALFVSSVEVTVPTTRLPQPAGGLDRDAGEGRGHLFRLDLAGNLLADLTLGEGSVYHPGGLDYDGRHIWVAVAEYRPNSRSIVYRVDPETMKATEVFRFADHIGAVVRNTDDNTLHGVSWGSRRFYRWTLGDDGRVTNADVPADSLRRLNPSHYVDYQDCKYVPRGRMLCTGVADLRHGPDSPSFGLGGLELIDLRDGRPLHQIPIALLHAVQPADDAEPRLAGSNRVGLARILHARG